MKLLLLIMVIFTSALYAKGQLYVFVSTNMSDEDLSVLNRDAHKIGGVLVLRGLIGNSFIKTNHRVRKIAEQSGAGISLDPELFQKFDIKLAPTFVLAKVHDLTGEVETFDKTSGNVSLRYALTEIKKRGEQKELASLMLGALDAK